VARDDLYVVLTDTHNTTTNVPRYTGNARPHVLMTTEGTYPHYTGGVSTWCDLLVKELGDVDFTIWALMMNPFVKQQFEFPSNVRQFVAVPLWGIEQPAEYTRELPTAQVFRASRRTRERDVEKHFLPIFDSFINTVASPIFDAPAFARTLVQMHDYFREWDYRTTWRSQPVWEAYRALAIGRLAGATYTRPPFEEDEPVLPTMKGINENIRFLVRGEIEAQRYEGLANVQEDEVPTVAEAIEGLRMLYRLMQPLNFEVPESDVTHSAAAAFCALPCLLAKLERNTPFLLTEHGVYLREQYLAIERRRVPYNLKRFLINLISSIAQTSYVLADQVSPVCAFNSRWEFAYGVPQERLKVIYNGVNQDVFVPQTVERLSNPTVVQVGRIDPLKDQVTFLRVAAAVHQEMPEVRFVHYGPIADDEYGDTVAALHKELGLEDIVDFRGGTKNPAGAYAEGDVVLLTSISEAFPYAVVEALMCGKPVVSTAVGGVHEALDGGIGLTAPAHDVAGLARAVLHYLQMSPAERADISLEARAHALANFTLDRFLDNHMETYTRLASTPATVDLRPFEVETIDLEAADAEREIVLEAEPEIVLEQPGAAAMTLDLDTIESLQAHLQGDDVFAKVEALRHVQPLPGVEPFLVEAAHDEMTVVRTQAVLALGRIGGPTALAAITELMGSDPAPEVREAAVTALLDLAASGNAGVGVTA